MDTFIRLITKGVIILFVMCQPNKERKFQEAYNDFYSLHCKNDVVFSINYGNRFGEDVIAVYCIANENREHLKKEMPERYKGYRIYIASPIWGVGELLPTFRKKIDSYAETHPNARVYGTEESKFLDDLYKQTILAEDGYWNKLAEQEKKIWISNYIKNRRKIDPNFANCGDKFLVQ